MTLTDALPLLAGLALGAWLARLVEKSGFSLDRVLRWGASYGQTEWRRAWVLALALLWLASAALSLTPLHDAAKPIPVGPVAAVVAGLIAGAAMAILAGDVVSLGFGMGRTCLVSTTAFAAWVAGYLLMSHGPLASLTVWLRSIGPAGLEESRLPGLAGAASALAGEHLRPVGEAVAAFLVPAALGLIACARLLREPVRVSPGRMEWPKQGAGLALLVALGWAIAIWGGETSGLNAVSAVETVREAAMGGRLWLHPSLLVTAGLVGYAFLKSLRLRTLFPRAVSSKRHAVIVVAAGGLLGVASAVAGGDPSAHAFFGLSTLSVGSMLFAVSTWMGARFAGRFDRRRHGRPEEGEA
ncbi:MAG: YeeE/YedE thiosulfate transporter family protein [Candidatus Coatesbacteria bacterium]